MTQGTLRKIPVALQFCRCPKVLRTACVQVAWHAPHAPAFAYTGMAMRSVADMDAALAAAHCVVIITDHSLYNWASIRQVARLVVDTRHVA